MIAPTNPPVSRARGRFSVSSKSCYTIITPSSKNCNGLTYTAPLMGAKMLHGVRHNAAGHTSRRNRARHESARSARLSVNPVPICPCLVIDCHCGIVSNAAAKALIPCGGIWQLCPLANIGDLSRRPRPDLLNRRTELRRLALLGRHISPAPRPCRLDPIRSRLDIHRLGVFRRRRV